MKDFILAQYAKQFNGQLRGVCPFRENHSNLGNSGDGSNSFFMTPEMNSYHCFSCKAKGRLSVILIEKFGMTISEISEIISKSSNYFISKKEDKSLIKKFATHKEVAKSRQDILLKNLQSPLSLKSEERELSFFTGKGISIDTLKLFKVSANLNFKRVWADENGKINEAIYYKVYAMPVIFYESIVEIWYRANLPKKQMWVAKDALNNASNNKNYLYNFDHAKNFEKVVICEGQTDLWKIFEYLQSPINEAHKNLGVIATLGTSFTDVQVNLVYSTWKEYIFAFDNDFAGLSASIKFSENLIAKGVHPSKLKFFSYPQNSSEKFKDPCDLTISEIKESLNILYSLSMSRYNLAIYKTIQKHIY
jgi:DNA primase